MARRELTDEEKQDWDEATRGTRKSRRAKPAAPAPVPPPASRTVARRAASPAPSAAKPPAAKPAPAPLSPKPLREAERLFKPHARIDATIDLHGMTQDEAHAALARFIARSRAAGKRHLAIITGKGARGEGVLRRAVPRWLELPELRRHVSAIAHARPEKGGEGVLHVLLKKPS